MTHEQLQQYLDNQCTPEEKKAVEKWLFAAHEDTIDGLLKHRWEQSGGKMPERERRALWQRLNANIVPAKKQAVLRIMPRRRYVAIAAVAILFVCAATVWFTVRSNWQRIANNSSVAKQVQLPDGSVVWLNGWSELAYYKNFNATRREVKLDGEAYFIVKEDKRRPFTVYAGDIATHVLGTEFNVEAYDSEKAVKVSLNKGKVAVGFRDKQSAPVKYLSPGEMLTSTRGKAMCVQAIAVQKAQAWIDGCFVVNDMNLMEVLNRMERRYNIRFHIDGGEIPATACQHVAATFTGESWQQIVKQLSFACHFEYRIRERDIHLTYQLSQ